MAKIVTKELSDGIKAATTHAEALLKVFGETLTTITAAADVLKKTKDGLNLADAKDLEKLNKLYAESNKLIDVRQKNDKETIKLQKEIEKNLQEEQKTRQQGLKTIQQEEKNRQELLKTQIVQQRALVQEQKEQERLEKLRLKQVAAASKETDAYKELTRSRNAAQNSFKALAAEFGESSTQAQEALVIFNDLDESFTSIAKAAKDGKPFVGRYAEAIAEAGIDGTKTAKVLLDLQKEQEELNKTIKAQTKIFGKNSQQVKDSEKQLERLDSTIDDIAKSSKNTEKAVDGLANAFKALATATVVLKAIEIIGDIFTASDSGAAGLAKTLGRVTIAIGVFVDRAIKSFGVLSNNFNKQINGYKLGWFEFLDVLNTKITIPGLGEIGGGLIDVTENLAKLRAEQAVLESSTLKITDVFAGFTDEIEKKVAANDKAIDQNLINIRQNAILRKGAAELSKEIEALARVYDDDSQALNDRNDKIGEAIIKQEELNDKNLAIADNEVRIAKLKKDASTDNIQAEADYIDAQTARIETEVQGLTELTGHIREQNSIRRDLRDIELDFLLDDTDNKKTINERIIANETETQAKRRKLLQENKKLIEDSFVGQTEAVNKELNDLGKAAIDFNEFLKLPTEGMVEFLNASGNETLSVRILGIIKDRRTALQDIVDTQTELAVSDREILKTQADIILQEDALRDLKKKDADSEAILAQLEKDRYELKKDNLRTEIEELTEGSKTKLELEQEYNDLLLKEEFDRLSKEKEAKDTAAAEDKERAEANAKFLREQGIAIGEAFLNGLDKQSKAREQALGEEITEAKTREGQLLELSASTDSKTSQLAADSLAEQRKIEREKTQEIAKEKRKQVTLEIALAGLAAFKANAGQPNAGVKTVAEIGTLIAGLSAIPLSFFSGTEDTGTHGKGTDGIGGFDATLHPNERVVPKSVNVQMGGIGNDLLPQAVDVFSRFRDGDLIEKGSGAVVSPTTIINNDNKELLKEFKGLKKELRNISNAQLMKDIARGTMEIEERKGNRVNKYII